MKYIFLFMFVYSASVFAASPSKIGRLSEKQWNQSHGISENCLTRLMDRRKTMRGHWDFVESDESGLSVFRTELEIANTENRWGVWLETHFTMNSSDNSLTKRTIIRGAAREKGGGEIELYPGIIVYDELGFMILRYLKTLLGKDSVKGYRFDPGEGTFYFVVTDLEQASSVFGDMSVSLGNDEFRDEMKFVFRLMGKDAP